MNLPMQIDPVYLLSEANRMGLVDDDSYRSALKDILKETHVLKLLMIDDESLEIKKIGDVIEEATDLLNSETGGIKYSSIRAFNCFVRQWYKRPGIKYVNELIESTDDDLAEIKGVGDRTLQILIVARDIAQKKYGKDVQKDDTVTDEEKTD